MWPHAAPVQFQHGISIAIYSNIIYIYIYIYKRRELSPIKPDRFTFIVIVSRHSMQYTSVKVTQLKSLKFLTKCNRSIMSMHYAHCLVSETRFFYYEAKQDLDVMYSLRPALTVFILTNRQSYIVYSQNAIHRYMIGPILSTPFNTRLHHARSSCRKTSSCTSTLIVYHTSRAHIGSATDPRCRINNARPRNSITPNRFYHV